MNITINIQVASDRYHYRTDEHGVVVDRQLSLELDDQTNPTDIAALDKFIARSLMTAAEECAAGMAALKASKEQNDAK